MSSHRCLCYILLHLPSSPRAQGSHPPSSLGCRGWRCRCWGPWEAPGAHLLCQQNEELCISQELILKKRWNFKSWGLQSTKGQVIFFGERVCVCVIMTVRHPALRNEPLFCSWQHQFWLQQLGANPSEEASPASIVSAPLN